MRYVYDIEIYPNAFFVTFINPDRSIKKEFALFNNKDYKNYGSIQDLKQFLLEKDLELIGYNNYSYDDIILKYIQIPFAISEDGDIQYNNIIITNSLLYECSYGIINGDRRNEYNRLKYTPHTWKKSYDIFNSYAQRGISLKELGIKKHYKTLQSLPYQFDTYLTEKEFDEVIKYNQHDINITLIAYNMPMVKSSFESKLTLENLFNVGSELTTIKNPKVAEEILANRYAEKTGKKIWEIKKIRSEREIIQMRQVIFKDIEFKSKELQTFLNNLLEKFITIDEVSKNLQYENVKQRIEFNGKQYDFGIGGLHSVDKQGKFYSNEEYKLIDVDVTSYYPSIMINKNIYPSNLGEEYLTTYKEIFDMRVKAKKSGDKNTSNGLKIVLNSTFGKLNDQYSFLYDPLCTLQVTINGQLYLLKLIEMFTEKGFEIISANTDGVLCKVKQTKLNEFDNIIKEWEQATGFGLEKSEYKTYVRRDVNNYLSEDFNGKLKLKGIFTINTDDYIAAKSQINIVKLALIDYFTKGIEPEKTIKNCKDLHEFLYYSKSSKDFIYSQNDLQVDDFVRWYVAKQGTGGAVIKKWGGKNGKKEIIPENKIKGKKKGYISLANSDNAIIVNNIENNSIPDNLDYNYYIEECWKLIDSVEKEEKKKSKKKDDPNQYSLFDIKKNDNFLEIVDKLRNMGLEPIPKYRKRNLKNDNMSSKWDRAKDYLFSEYPTIGLRTGYKFNLLSVDIDNYDKLPVDFEIDDTMVSYHCPTNEFKEYTIKELIEKKIKFKALYLFSNPDYLSSKAENLKNFGFEIQYGATSISVYGDYDGKEKYNIVGELNELSEKDFKQFKEILKKNRKNEVNIDYDIDEYSEMLNLLEHVMTTDFNWNYKRVKMKGSAQEKLIGKDPFYDHKDGSNTEYNIYLSYTHSGWKVYHNCFHEHCKDILTDKLPHIQNLFDTYKRSIKPKYFMERSSTEDLQTAVNDALQSKENFVNIIAPTGSGKTYEMIFTAINRLNNNKPTILVSQNKKHIENLKERLKSEDINFLEDERILVLQAGTNLSEYNLEEIKLIITHHTYIKRKGHSAFIFSLWKYIDTYKPLVLIDEIDYFLNSNIISINLQERYKKAVDKGQKDTTVYTKLRKCHATKKGCYKVTCDQCINGNNSIYTYNEIDNIYEFFHENIIRDYSTNRRFNQKQGIDQNIFNNLLESEIKLTDLNTSYTNINNSKHFLKQIDISEREFVDDENKIYDVNDFIKDIIKTGYNPKLIRFYPTYKEGLEIDLNDIREMEIKERKELVKFPYYSCNTQMLDVYDCLPLLLFKSTKVKVIGFTATWHLEELIKNAVYKVMENKVKLIKVDNSEQRIKKITYIGINGNLSVNDLSMLNMMLNNINLKMLKFTPTAEGATKLYNKIQKQHNFTDIAELTGKGTKDYTRGMDGSFDDEIMNKYSMFVMGSLTAYARGYDFKPYDIAIVDADIYKPRHLGIDTADKNLNSDDIKTKISNQRLTYVNQNVGRICRSDNKNAYKVAIVENCVDSQDLYFMKNNSGVNELALDYCSSEFIEDGSNVLEKLIELIQINLNLQKDMKEVSKNDMYKKGSALYIDLYVKLKSDKEIKKIFKKKGIYIDIEEIKNNLNLEDYKDRREVNLSKFRLKHRDKIFEYKKNKNTRKAKQDMNLKRYNVLLEELL